MREHLLTAAAFYYSVIAAQLGVNHPITFHARNLITDACDSGDDIASITVACDDLRKLHDAVINDHGIPASQFYANRLHIR